MQAKVLITGATGFIGHWLERNAPEYVRGVGHDEYDAGYWQDETWRYIIHLAPVPVNRVLKCAHRCNATVLLASSGGVYDREPDAYFRMKLEDESCMLASGLDVKIARIFTTCGAWMKWERYAIGNFIKQAEQGGPINVQSFGVVVRSYMYASDLAEWLWTILLKGESGGIYNVGSDEPHTTHELAFEIKNHFPPAQINVIRKMSYEPRPFYVPDIARARDELGLSIKVPFVEAVTKTIKDYEHENHLPTV